MALSAACLIADYFAYFVLKKCVVQFQSQRVQSINNGHTKDFSMMSVTVLQQLGEKLNFFFISCLNQLNCFLKSS
jgi:hypothetical protein